MPTKKSTDHLYKMEIHDKEVFYTHGHDSDRDLVVLRVPGGWIYYETKVTSSGGISMTGTFVPFVNESKPVSERDPYRILRETALFSKDGKYMIADPSFSEPGWVKISDAPGIIL